MVWESTGDVLCCQCDVIAANAEMIGWVIRGAALASFARSRDHAHYVLWVWGGSGG